MRVGPHVDWLFDGRPKKLLAFSAEREPLLLPLVMRQLPRLAWRFHSFSEIREQFPP